MRSVEVIKMLDSVTATTTSNNFDVSGAKKICFLVTRANHSSGSSAFTFAGGMAASPHTTAPTTVALNVIETNVANTNSQTILRTTGATLSSNTSSLLWLDLEQFPVQFVNCTVTETTDGTHSCWMMIVKED